MLIMTEYEKNLLEKIRPYMDGSVLKEDAPKSIKSDYDKLMEWASAMDGVQ